MKRNKGIKLFAITYNILILMLLSISVGYLMYVNDRSISSDNYIGKSVIIKQDTILIVNNTGIFKPNLILETGVILDYDIVVGLDSINKVIN